MACVARSVASNSCLKVACLPAEPKVCPSVCDGDADRFVCADVTEAKARVSESTFRELYYRLRSVCRVCRRVGPLVFCAFSPLQFTI